MLDVLWKVESLCICLGEEFGFDVGRQLNGYGHE